MADELRRLVRKRKATKASIDALSNYIDRFDPSVHSHRQLQIRLTRLETLTTEFNMYQNKILDLDKGEENEEERLLIEDLTLTLIAKMEDLIATHAPAEIVNTTNSSHASIGDSLRLPTIQLPSFNGNLEDWPSFFDTFNALIHNNNSLNDVQRLHYLKTTVCGSAADIIKNFTITSENYQAAYDELVRQYENKGLTIQTHVRALLLQSPKVTSPSASDLRKLHHHIASHVRALKALGQPVQHWDAWLVTLVCIQLDPITAGEWQLRQNNKELPTYADIELFLSKRVSAYEVCNNSVNAFEKSTKTKPTHHSNSNNKAFFTQSKDQRTIKCPLCNEQHKLYFCEKFKLMSIADRRNVVMKAKLCFNCLNYGHQVSDCKFSHCPKCNKKHNSKLHDDRVVIDESITHESNEQSSSNNQTVLYAGKTTNSKHNDDNMNVMLSTSEINVFNRYGKMQVCRAVLDSGSQLNFISTDCALKLGLSSHTSSINITGIDSISSTATDVFQATFTSRLNNYKFTASFHALSTIVDTLPSVEIDRKSFVVPIHLQGMLADPQFHIPGKIDILLGSEIFFEVLSNEKWILSNHASLHNTKLGWIIAGKLPIVSQQNSLMSTTIAHNSAMSFFVTKTACKISEEIKAEEHFQSTCTRNPDGRYVVKLPMSQDPSVLGDSRAMALKRFLNVEKRLAKDPSLAMQYKVFMDEYLKLGHMELASPTSSDFRYYLPHHPVFKASSTTTKMRVVFDGSANTSTGISLNDVLLKGAKVQPDIFQILIRFRIHQVTITADVEKMYRQVLVAPEDRNLQRILYRSNPTDKLSEYRLCTVTYGTKSASYLATRCLSEVSKFIDDPKICRVISEDFYVDDLLSGGATENECYQIYDTLLSTMSSAGFSLRKWCSNSTNLINRIPTACEDSTFVMNLNDEDMISALGISWQPISDQLRYTFKKWIPPSNMTKRTLLSDINSIYDPIGLISPALIRGKIFIQQLWGMKIGWDDILPVNLQSRWIKFYESLQSLQDLTIPRKVVGSSESKVNIHGFCDASQEAFGACLYLHSITSDGHVQVHLLTSKSRVAPMKATTIPRLELCGALLLAELLSETKIELNRLNMRFDSTDISLWTDSSIVLAWLKNEVPLQSYVANRVARILEITTYEQWRHVPSMDNPADLITRGIQPHILSTLSMWWNGPSWLCQESDTWPSNPKLPREIPEIRPVKLVLVTTRAAGSWLLDRYSNYMQLIRITALILRFVQNCKTSRQLGERATDALSIHDLKLSREFWIRSIQAESYSSELKALKSNLSIHRSSCLVKLNPFIDPNGILRVGGRLAYAPISDNTKFPIVLPCSSTFTRLLFRYEHLRLLHVGPQALLSHIQINYWPIRGRNLASRTVHQCIQCFRTKPRLVTPFMAPLPRQRITIERPFSQCGVDFCGPIMIRSGIRRITSVKAYISVFVCLVTRAIHLELVSTLTTDAFLATLTRFMSRRGQCRHLYSDNGTNFVGANRKLIAQFQDIAKTHAASSFLTEKSIQWHFIPPAAPHFGGLWEAAVKSAKQHLTKLSINSTFTFEEATTLLCGIEGVLNSRPMTPLSNDPSDHQALTPAHFLIGGVITLPPDSDVSTIPMSRLKRFTMVQSYIQQFWERWSKEYLPQLQRRGRWLKVTRNMQVGDLCLLRQEKLPPTKWALVRVQEVHPGPDGTVRVVTIRNSSGTTFQRPVIKLSLLPTEEDEMESQSESLTQ